MKQQTTNKKQNNDFVKAAKQKAMLKQQCYAKAENKQ